MSWETLAADPLSRKIYIVEISVADPAKPEAEREILRFSSDCIDPALCDNFYEPCVKSLPTLTRSVQALTLGRTAAAFGNLSLLTGGGHLDDDIRSKLFAGAGVSVKLGFGCLAVSDFREIFSGRVRGNPVWDDTKLNLPLADAVRDLLDKKTTEQTLSGALPTVVSTLLDSVGLTADKRDSEMWTAFAAENNFNVWLKTTANQSVGSVLDILLAPLACWYGFSRAGKFRVATFAAPAADETPALSLSDIELFKFSEANHGKQNWKITVSYYSATGDAAETAERTWEDASILELNPSAQEVSKKTMLTSQANADAVRDRWKDLFSVRRLVATVSAASELFKLNIGDCVRVTRDRLNVDHVYRVQKVTDEMNKNNVTLELFK